MPGVPEAGESGPRPFPAQASDVFAAASRNEWLAKISEAGVRRQAEF